MLNRNHLIAAVLSLACAGCAGTYGGLPKDGVQLLKKDIDSGAVTYRLYPGNNGKPTVRRTMNTTTEKAILGVVVESINLNLSKRLGVPPWDGVWIANVSAGSSAARAGISHGDIIRSVGGVKLANKEQCQELLPTLLQPGNPIAIELLKPSESDGVTIYSPLTLDVIPDSKKVAETTTDSYPLETSKGVQQVTGLQLAIIPPDLASDIYGYAEPVTLVSGTVIGSPAYLSGFRAGDRVVRCGGEQSASLHQIRDMVWARAVDMDLPASTFELPDAALVESTQMEAADGDLDLQVLGPLGSHSATLEVADDVMNTSSFNFPILFDFDSRVDRTSWSFLDFIFQFGANYSSRYVRSETRNPAERTSLSLFPLGMFEFRTSPTSSEYTFFWLIDWETRD